MAVTDTDGATPSQHPFRNRDFRIYWAGGALSNSGTWLYNVSASVLMYDLTGSPFMVGVLNFANFLPILLFSVLGGVASDRFDRRKLVAGLSAVSSAISIAIAAAEWSGLVAPVVLILFSLALGTGYAFAKPALAAILPSVVGRFDLAHATAINTLQFTVGQVVGSTLSALVLALWAPWTAFALNGLTYLGPVVAMVVLRSRITQEARGKARGLAAIKEGFAFVLGPGQLLGIVVAIVFANGLSEALRTLAPVLTERGLGLASADAGLLIGATGAGAFVGILSFGTVSRLLGRRWMSVTGFALQMGGAAVVAVSTILPAAMLGSAVMGLGFSFIIPLLSGSMLERAPDELRGRVMAAFSMAHLGFRPIGALAAGGTASIVGPRWTLVVFLVSAVAGLVALRWGRALEIEEPSVGESDPRNGSD